MRPRRGGLREVILLEAAAPVGTQHCIKYSEAGAGGQVSWCRICLFLLGGCWLRKQLQLLWHNLFISRRQRGWQWYNMICNCNKGLYQAKVSSQSRAAATGKLWPRLVASTVLWNHLSASTQSSWWTGTLHPVYLCCQAWLFMLCYHVYLGLYLLPLL